MRRIAVISLLTLLMTGCFPSRSVEYSERGEAPEISLYNASAKLFFSDGSVILMPQGMQLSGDTIIGIGQRHSLLGDTSRFRKYHIPLDSVAAITYYENNHNAGEVLGSAVFGYFGPLYSFLSVYCLICPKCCFGCCPTVYVCDGEEETLMAECFSYCISPFTQKADLDLLAREWDPEKPFRIRVANEALETHSINTLTLLAADHPRGSSVFPAPDGRILGVRDVRVPSSVRNSVGRDMTPMIREKDDIGYRSGTNIFADRAEKAKPDWLTFPIDDAGGADSVTIMLRLRNTLLSTVLFYDIVLASQGMQALEWTQRMAENRPYALLFTALYEQYSGIRCLTGGNGDFEEAAHIGDIGPIAWTEIAVRVPLEKDRREIRLEFFPDNVAIDWIGWSVESLREDEMHITTVRPTEARDYRDVDISALLSRIRHHDEDFLVHEPGDNIRLTYDIPDSRKGCTSLLLASSGYYYEWLRGGWIREHGAGRALNIFNRGEILAQLHHRWLETQDGLEKAFFNNRVPLKEVSQ
ncbi:MAG: hypothetical protein JXA28_13945 [Bacteroidetes bacterium]|nr:hypothetical protein [Bacteroidota bacterium]